jgi:hypothetical protein
VTPRHPDTDRLAALLHEARCGPESTEHLPWTDDHHEWDVATATALLLLGLRLPAEPEAPDPIVCANCLRIVPEVDAETGDCRSCYRGFASPPVPTPEPPAEPSRVTLRAASAPVAEPGLREAAQAVIDAMDYTKGSAAYLAALKALRAALAGATSSPALDAPQTTIGGIVHNHRYADNPMCRERMVGECVAPRDRFATPPADDTPDGPQA